MSRFEKENKEIRIILVARDKATNEVETGVAWIIWRKEVSLKKIVEHAVDAIERIDL